MKTWDLTIEVPDAIDHRRSLVVLPLAEFVVEHVGVVDDHALEEPVELFGVDAVRAFDAPMFVKLLRGRLVAMLWRLPGVGGLNRPGNGGGC
jgi:hypothetical protein